MSENQAPLAYDPTKIGQLADAAPEAGFSKLRFGRLTMAPFVVTWSEEGGVRVPHRVPFVNQELPKQATLEFNFVVDIKEFSPRLDFLYERNIGIRKTRIVNGVKSDPTDWTEVVEPSLIKVFGKHWPLELLKAPYVCVEDVPNAAGRTSKTTGKPYGIPKFIKRYPSRDAAYAAFKDAMPEGSDDAGGAGGSSNGSGGIPAATLADVRELVEANGVDSVRALLAGKPYGDFEPDALLSAAGFPPA